MTDGRQSQRPPVAAPGHVAVFLLSLGLGGAERNMLTLIRHLAARGHRVDVVLIRADGPFLDCLPEAARLVDLGARSKVGALPGLVRYLRRARPDTLLSAMASVNCIAVLARMLAGVPVRLVLSERSTLSMEVARAPAFRVLPAAMRRLYPKADAVIAVSEGVADDLSQTIGLARERIEVIYNPVLTRALLQGRDVPLDDPWFAPDAPPVVLAVGRLHEQKDYATLIAAFARLRATRPCRLVILGEGPEREALERAAAATGHGDDIRLPGVRQEPYPSMARAGVFALSSRWEGLPTVLIEALACGVPVVSTDCPSGPAEILEGGRHGRLVPVGDAAALAEALAEALDGPRPGPEAAARFAAGPLLARHEAVLLPEPDRARAPLVGLLLPNLGGGGAERVALNLARQFVDAGYRVDLVVMQGKGALIDQVPEGARLVDLRVGWRIFALPRLARYFRRERPQALLSSMASSNCIAWGARLLARSGTRLAVSEHSTLSVEVRRNWYRRLLPVVMARAYPRCDAVVAVSRGVADDLAAMIGLARERIEVVHNAVIGPELEARSREVPAHPWFAPGAPPVILAVGRLARQKNFELLIEVFAKLRRQREARLLILGEGEERAMLEALVARLGLGETVAMPGFVDNPHAYMRAAALFVLSSRWEGLPTVLIEALACGARVVATDCPSGPAEILEDGRLGRLVPVEDGEALLAAVLAALDDPPPGPRDLKSYTHAAAFARYEAVLVPDPARRPPRRVSHAQASPACVASPEPLPPKGTATEVAPMPVQASEIERLLRARFPNARIEIRDLAGDGNHYAATVVDEEFRGMNRVQQQRLVNQALKPILEGANAPLHALALQTSAPD